MVVQLQTALKIRNDRLFTTQNELHFMAGVACKNGSRRQTAYARFEFVTDP